MLEEDVATVLPGSWSRVSAHAPAREKHSRTVSWHCRFNVDTDERGKGFLNVASDATTLQ